jgi:hypothetical protein
VQPVVLHHGPLTDPDFAAIRRDLRSTLSEWCLEPGTPGSEAAIDTFMRRLRVRLGYSEQREESRATL